MSAPAVMPAVIPLLVPALWLLVLTVMLPACAALAGLVLYRRGALAQSGALQSARFGQALLHALPAAVIGTDRAGLVRYMNPRAALLSGWTLEQALGKPIADLLAVYQDGAALDPGLQLRECVQRAEVLEAARGAVLLRRSDGKRIDVQYSCAPHGDARDGGALLLLHDVSARRGAEAQLEFIAHHDALTGLPNRLHFQIRFEHGIAYARRHRGLLAVLFVDIDRFKAINDSLGHDVGDQVLVEFARRVGQCVRKVDTVARQGGDEFIILLTEMHAPQDADRVAEKIVGAIAAPFIVGEYSLAVAASVGLAIYPDDDDELHALIEKADLAMYAAKRAAPGTCLRYAPRMQSGRGMLEAALSHALERQEFLLYYQPRVDLRTRRIKGVKALLRWKHPDLGLVMPLDFLPVLEDSGAILPVGAWVLHSAVAQAATWIAQGQALTVSVCLSARQFYQRDLATRLAALLTDAGVPGAAIELEIAGAVLGDGKHNGVEVLRQLRALGVTIAIGGFGTGDASLNYLKRFPADTLKIEKCFVDDLNRDGVRDGAADCAGDPAAMVRAIVAMAQALGLRSVAGGVETADQLRQLDDLGCDEAFGFHLGRAMAPAGIDGLLKRGVMLHDGQ